MTEKMHKGHTNTVPVRTFSSFKQLPICQRISLFSFYFSNHAFFLLKKQGSPSEPFQGQMLQLAPRLKEGGKTEEVRPGK